jgi:hypothetical protein
MTDVVCKDCGRAGAETPDDPAPNLCPSCYEKRLERITPLFMAKVEAVGDDGDITSAIAWLAQALEEIGGETRKAAREHANYLGHMASIESHQQQN